MNYKRLSIQEREEISRQLVLGLSLREIGRRIDRHASTVSRELRRFSWDRYVYRAISGQQRANSSASRRRFGKRKLVLNPALLEVVREKMGLFWSPRQIAEHLKSQYESSQMQASAETIYTYIYVFLRRELREEFSKNLRRGHKKRRSGVIAKQVRHQILQTW